MHGNHDNGTVNEHDFSVHFDDDDGIDHNDDLATLLVHDPHPLVAGDPEHVRR